MIYLDGTAPNSAHRLAYKVNIYLGRVPATFTSQFTITSFNCIKFTVLKTTHWS